MDRETGSLSDPTKAYTRYSIKYISETIDI